jgi:hypothetical protein
MTQNFHVLRRNHGHWDICNKEERLFRIRGVPDDYCVIGEHSKQGFSVDQLKSVQACMAIICDEMMFESLTHENVESVNIDGCGNLKEEKQ